MIWMNMKARMEIRGGYEKAVDHFGSRWRRHLWILAVIFLSALVSAISVRDARAQNGFGFENVAEYAEALADKAFETPAPIPDALTNLGYDAYRKIRFRPDMAVWRDQSLFEIQMFHLGNVQRFPVRINLVTDNQIVQVPFRKEMFDYGGLDLPQELAEGLGFAGFRVHYPLHTPDYNDEIAVFLGASYFRILGRDQRFGASARGLAVDTGSPRGEEFPYFREFWLVKPGEHDTEFTLYALLDSQRLAGAYAFRITPGTETRVDVKSRIYLRDEVEKLGIAPLTSMYFFGENSLRHFDDFRPEVHDSDGLLIRNGRKEWIWRPLVNPSDLRVSAFIDENPLGFGLMQRDREFSNYLDFETHYDSRPSFWVEPIGEWGSGAVELIEIPTEDETNDNIVAFWVPDQKVKKGDVLDFSYRLFAQLENPYRPSLGRTVRTRVGSPEVPGASKTFSDETRLFVVDFKGGDLVRMSSQQPMVADITTSEGRIVDKIVVNNIQTGEWRAAFRLDPQGADFVDVKVLSASSRPSGDRELDLPLDPVAARKIVAELRWQSGIWR